MGVDDTMDRAKGLMMTDYFQPPPGAWRIELPYPPYTGNNQYGKGRGGRKFLKPEMRGWQARVWAACVDYVGALNGTFVGPVALAVQWYPPDRRRRDGDNLAKVIKDALTKAWVWEDDSQVEKLYVEKHAPVKGGKVVVTIQQIGGGDVG